MNRDDDKIKFNIADPTLKRFWEFQEIKRRYWYRPAKPHPDDPCDFWDVHFASEEDKTYFMKVLDFIAMNPPPK